MAEALIRILRGGWFVCDAVWVNAYDRSAAFKNELIDCKLGLFSEVLGMNDEQDIDVFYFVGIGGNLFYVVHLVQLANYAPGGRRLLVLHSHQLCHVAAHIITHDRQRAEDAETFFVAGDGSVNQIAYVIFDEILALGREECDGFFDSPLSLKDQAEKEALLFGNGKTPETVAKGLCLLVGEWARVDNLQLDHAFCLASVFVEEGLDEIIVFVEVADLVWALHRGGFGVIKFKLYRLIEAGEYGLCAVGKAVELLLCNIDSQRFGGCLADANGRECNCRYKNYSYDCRYC